MKTRKEGPNSRLSLPEKPYKRTNRIAAGIASGALERVAECRHLPSARVITTADETFEQHFVRVLISDPKWTHWKPAQHSVCRSLQNCLHEGHLESGRFASAQSKSLQPTQPPETYSVRRAWNLLFHSNAPQ